MDVRVNCEQNPLLYLANRTTGGADPPEGGSAFPDLLRGGPDSSSA